MTVDDKFVFDGAGRLICLLNAVHWPLLLDGKVCCVRKTVLFRWFIINHCLNGLVQGKI